jgi:hypothetical protein
MSQPPYAADAKLADLTFVSGATEGITQLVFRDHLPVSRFSDIDGYAINTQVVDGPIIIVDNTPPTNLSLTVDPPCWASSPVTLTFSATDALSGIDRYELDYGGGDILTVTSPYALDTSQLPTGTHVVTITAYDRAGNSASVSTTMWIAAPPCIVAIGEAKDLEDGTFLEMAGPIVTRLFDGYFYVEDYKRSSGIRINCDPEQMPTVGSTPMFSGTIQTIDGERVIVLDSIETFGPVVDVPLPLAMNTRATSIGLSPVGLLVKLAGRVSSVTPAEEVFAISDGAEENLQVKLYGVSLPPLDAFVAVTGALGADLAGPLVRVNNGLDLQIVGY